MLIFIPIMLVFIDESGCAGFKFVRGSIEHFVVAMVAFRDRTVARRTDEIIRQTQIDLNIYPEFKFSDSRDAVRDEFFRRVVDQRFEVRAIVVHKPSMNCTHPRGHRERFYNYFVKNLVKYNANAMTAADVRIDGSGDRVFKRELNAYLRRESPAGCVSSVRFIDSRRDHLIQLADMCVGAIARSYRADRGNPGRWREMLRPRIANVWEFQ
jgi:Protein of unknown function (DUF3800)